MTGARGKPVEIEGFFDLRFYTPLGGVVARRLARTTVTPDQVSWASVAVAGAAAVAYGVQTLPTALIGSALLLASGILDSTDGQLARATGRTSEFGETLDGLCDTLSFGLIYLVAAVGFVGRGGSPWLAVALFAAAGWSHSVQSSLVDFERQVFAHIVHGSTRIAREEPATLAADRDRARAAGEGWGARLLRSMRIAYCRRQRQWLASTAALLTDWRAAGLSDAERRLFAGRYRDAMRPLLKAWTVLAPNSHTLGILLAGLLPFLIADPVVARWGLALAFGFDLLLNVPMLALIVAQRRVDARLRMTLTGDERTAGAAFGRATA